VLRFVDDLFRPRRSPLPRSQSAQIRSWPLPRRRLSRYRRSGHARSREATASPIERRVGHASRPQGGTFAAHLHSIRHPEPTNHPSGQDERVQAQRGEMVPPMHHLAPARTSRMRLEHERWKRRGDKSARAFRRPLCRRDRSRRGRGCEHRLDDRANAALTLRERRSPPRPRRGDLFVDSHTRPPSRARRHSRERP